MGTDVYLQWDGKTSEEGKAQCTGWAIDAGDIGYLRACISMVRENGVLRMLFPEKYWSRRSKEEYDFKGNFEQLNAIGLRYLVSVVKGVPFEIGEDQQEGMKKQQETAAAILQSIKSMVPEGGKISVGEITDFRDAVAWLESMFCFFEIGIEKQEQGLKPYPYISW
jgi:hypothetical protein